MGGEGAADAAFQHPNVYNSRLPDPAGHHADSLRYLAEIKAGLAVAVLRQDHNQAVVWVINLHKYIILYGLKFTRPDHVYLIKVVFGLLTTRHVDPHILDKHAKVLSALLKKKYLIPRSELQLDWRPLFQLLQSWEDSSPAVRGLLKAPQGFKAQVKAVVKVSRGYFTDSSTAEMLAEWSHMLCPADRAMATAVRYLSLFLPTTKDIPPELSWRLWLPLLSSFWQTWGNSPVWEVPMFGGLMLLHYFTTDGSLLSPVQVDLLRLYSRLAFHRVGQVPWEPLMPDLYTRFLARWGG
jgi:proteasome activator subunit 4